MSSTADDTADTDTSKPLNKPAAKVWPKVAAVLIGVTIVMVLIWGPVELTHTLLEWWQQETGPLGAIGFALFYVAATACFVPAAVLGVGAGFLFGPLWGALIAAACRPLGSLVSFVVARHLARHHVENWIEDWPKFGLVDRLTREEPFRVVVLLRLVPVLTFNVTNHVFGLTAVDWKKYFGATFLGVLPGSMFYVYIGVTASDLTRAVALEEAPALEDHLVTWIVVGVAFLGVITYLFVRARRHWREMMAERNVHPEMESDDEEKPGDEG